MTDRFLDLAKGEAEIAVRAHEPGDDMLVARKVADMPWAVYASRSYLDRYGGPERTEDINHHKIIEFSGEMVRNPAGRWLRAVAPQAVVGARGNTMLGLVTAVKSGMGLAPLPMMLGEPEDNLVRVLDPPPELHSKIYLVMHSDLRHTPRVRAFVDFVIAEKDKFAALPYRS